jgi:hypothetical protein
LENLPGLTVVSPVASSLAAQLLPNVGKRGAAPLLPPAR